MIAVQIRAGPFNKLSRNQQKHRSRDHRYAARRCQAGRSNAIEEPAQKQDRFFLWPCLEWVSTILRPVMQALLDHFARSPSQKQIYRTTEPASLHRAPCLHGEKGYNIFSMLDVATCSWHRLSPERADTKNSETKSRTAA